MITDTGNTGESAPLQNTKQDLEKPVLKGRIPINDQLRLKLHFDQTPLGIIEWDKDFKVIRWNPAAEKIFGFSEEEAIGIKGNDFLVAENAKATTEKVEVKVKDTGVGMNKDEVSKLFRIDEDIASPVTNKEKGTGLGLMLCKEIIQKHGSAIKFSSKIGKDSCVSFILKLASSGD